MAKLFSFLDLFRFINEGNFRQLSIVTTSLFLGIILAEGTLRFFNSNGKNYDVEMWKYSKQLKSSEDVNIGHEHKPNAKAMLQNVEIRTNKYA